MRREEIRPTSLMPSADKSVAGCRWDKLTGLNTTAKGNFGSSTTSKVRPPNLSTTDTVAQKRNSISRQEQRIQATLPVTNTTASANFGKSQNAAAPTQPPTPVTAIAFSFPGTL